MKRIAMGLVLMAALLIGNALAVFAAQGGQGNQCTHTSSGQGHAYGLSKHCLP